MNINTLLHDEKLRLKLTKNGMEWAGELNWDISAMKWLGLVGDALKREYGMKMEGGK